MALDYGLIGNCRTAALVSKSGSIDWCCFPRFDSPSVFAKILDEKKGGSFEITPVGKYGVSQRYLPSTNILETTFYRLEDEFKVYDFFPRYRYGEKVDKLPQITRYVKVVRGMPKVRILFNPKFNYAKGKTTMKIVANHITAKSGQDMLFLYSDLPLEKIMKQEVCELNSEHFLVASYKQHVNPSLSMVRLLFNRTKAYWLDFVRFSSLPPRYRKEVIRSILALKLMTYETGSIIAAPTTSLPEIIGGVRNWDYRYCWVRDSSFTVDALTKICHFDEAETYIQWLTSICAKSRKGLQAVYRVDGGRSLPEKTLKHLSGYKNSRPVRIGNAAYLQRQIDVYGEILETFYLFFMHYNYAEIELKHWKVIQKLVNTVIRQWRNTDSGIWEFRGLKRHFTFSKVMCWVALDRGVKIAKHRKDYKTAAKWAKIRDKIKEDVMKKAWSSKLQAFTQYYGSESLDSSNLLMSYFGFLPATHPKMAKTIMATKKRLTKNSLVFRYLEKDDFGDPKNAFTICTFWLIDALYLMGSKEEANKLFRKALKHGNHLGLYSEDIDTVTHELTGNFPQAYTHLAIVNTATLLATERVRRAMCNIRVDMLRD